jgi:hypothetical protein
LAATASRFRCSFHFFLKRHAREYSVLGDPGLCVLGFDSDHHTAVGERRIATRKAHSINDDFVVFGCSRDDESTRAHAKRKYAAILDLRRQTVARGWQKFVPWRSFWAVVLAAVDEFL